MISAYALVFGGFLLLGGRTADVLGTPRVHGRACASSPSARRGPRLVGDVADRGARDPGLGAATISPAALAILMTTFAEGRERNIALGVWGAVGGSAPPRASSSAASHRRAVMGMDLLRQHPRRAVAIALAPVLPARAATRG